MKCLKVLQVLMSNDEDLVGLYLSKPDRDLRDHEEIELLLKSYHDDFLISGQTNCLSLTSILSLIFKSHNHHKSNPGRGQVGGELDFNDLYSKRYEEGKLTNFVKYLTKFFEIFSLAS